MQFYFLTISNCIQLYICRSRSKVCTDGICNIIEFSHSRHVISLCVTNRQILPIPICQPFMKLESIYFKKKFSQSYNQGKIKSVLQFIMHRRYLSFCSKNLNSYFLKYPIQYKCAVAGHEVKQIQTIQPKHKFLFCHYFLF